MTQVRRTSNSRRPWLSHLVRHPVGTVRRSHNKTINEHGFGLGLLAAVSVFFTIVVVWLASRLVPLLLH